MELTSNHLKSAATVFFPVTLMAVLNSELTIYYLGKLIRFANIILFTYAAHNEQHEHPFRVALCPPEESKSVVFSVLVLTNTCSGSRFLEICRNDTVRVDQDSKDVGRVSDNSLWVCYEEHRLSHRSSQVIQCF